MIFKFKHFDIHLYISKTLLDLTIVNPYGNTGFSIYFKDWYKITPKVVFDIQNGYSLIADWLIFSYFTWGNINESSIKNN